MRFWPAARPPATTATEPVPQPEPAIAAVPSVQSIIDALTVGVVVDPGAGQRPLVNATMRALTTEGLRSSLVQAAIDRATAQAKAGSEYRESVDFAGVPTTSYIISATPLADNSAVAVVEDVSERRQVEAIRRDFVTNVGHELRTPIGAILILAEALEGETNPDQIVEMRRLMTDEAQRAADLIDELLSLSKVQSAKTFALETLDVNDLIDEVVTQVQPSALGAKITLKVSRPPVNTYVSGIRTDLISALTNLVLNACKYSGDSDLVSLLVSVESKGFCHFRVIDHGIGIPASAHERIFERFYRVDQSRDRATGGSGLGLAIVRHVAANHGGWVSVQSREGEGSTFTLGIPLKKVGT